MKKFIDNIKSYINSINRKRQQKKYDHKRDTVSDDVEKAAKHHLYSNILYDDVYVGNPTDEDCIEMFKAGANWQKEKDEKEKSDIFDIAVDVGRKLGETDMKQQLMAQAVVGEICEDSCGCLYAHVPMPCSNGFSRLDKIRVLIIKED